MEGVLKILLRPQSQAITILGINYKGMRGQKQVWEGKLTTDTSSCFSLFLPIIPCLRFALVPIIPLSHTSLVSRSRASTKPWETCGGGS